MGMRCASAKLGSSLPGRPLFNADSATLHRALIPWTFSQHAHWSMESQMRMRAVSGTLAVAATAIALAGCHPYVKQEAYDPAVSGFRANDAAMRSDLDCRKSQLDTRISACDATTSE